MPPDPTACPWASDPSPTGPTFAPSAAFANLSGVHGNLHAYQLSATAFGLFLTDLEELAVDAVVEHVRLSMRSEHAVLGLEHWVAHEDNTLIRRYLEGAVALHGACRRLGLAALGAERPDQLAAFEALYGDVQQKLPDDRWRGCSSAAREGNGGAVDGPAPSARWVAEAAAALCSPEGTEKATSTEGLWRRLTGVAGPLPEGVEASLRSALPTEPAALVRTFLLLADLALMAPLGRLHAAEGARKAPVLLPGWRLLAAAETLHREGLAADGLEGDDGIEGDAVRVIEAVSAAMRWPRPSFLAYRIREDSCPRLCGYERLGDCQRHAAGLRLASPHLPGAPGAAFLEEQAESFREAAAEVRATVRCADLWMTGQPSEELGDPEAARFEALFGVALASYLPSYLPM